MKYKVVVADRYTIHHILEIEADDEEIAREDAEHLTLDIVPTLEDLDWTDTDSWIVYEGDK